MSAIWEDLDARVRGLSTRLLGREQWEQLTRAHDLRQLGSALEATRAVVVPPSGTAPEELEIAVRRTAAQRIRILSRWSGPRTRFLTPLLLDEDRRSVRAMVRGAAASVPAAQRLAGLVPTPALGERALEELAAQRSVGAVAAMLVALGHPFGGVMLADARRETPDLFRLDLLVNREFVARSLAAARRTPRGDRARRDLLALVRRIVDVENAWTALQLAMAPSTVDPATLFLDGGRSLDRATFLDAARARSVDLAADRLARGVRADDAHTSLAPIFRDPSGARWEDVALRTELRRTRAAARRSPLGIAPIIAFAARLRAEVRDLRLIIWRVSLGAPPVAEELLGMIA